jgi:hypothetical protein
VAGESLFDLFRSWIRILSKNGFGSHDHAVGAVAALRRLFGIESGLYGIGFLGRAESLQGGNRFACHLSDRSRAGLNNPSVNQNTACSTLPEATAELRAMQSKRIPEYIKERLCRIPRIHCERLSVHPQTVRCHRILLGRIM